MTTSIQEKIQSPKATAGKVTYGLLNGQTGMAVVYYLLAKQQQNELWKERALHLLNEVSDHITTVQSLQFHNGIAGIGWAVEWLVQHQLLADTNTDEVLEDVDDTLYKSVLFAKDEHISLLHGTMGKMVYFLKRAASKNEGTHHFRHICHNECVVILTDDLEEKLIQQQGMKQDITDTGMALIQMAAIPTINKSVTENILYKTAEYVIPFLTNVIDTGEENATKIKLNDYHNYLYLSCCLLIAARIHNQSYWEMQANTFIGELLLWAQRTPKPGREQLFKRLTVYCLLHIYYKGASMENQIQALIDELKQKTLPHCLYNGAGAIMLAEMCLADAGLLPHWYELFFIKA